MCPLPTLHRAVLASTPDDAPALEALLAAGADDLEERDRFGRTALYLAAKKRRTRALLALLAAGASVRAVNEHGRTPLHAAASHGHEAGVRALLAAGADRAARDAAGKKPAHVAYVALRPLLASPDEEDGA